MKFIEHYSARLDVCRFATSGLAVYAKEISDVRTRGLPFTAVGAWINQGCHWDGRSAKHSHFQNWDTDSPLVWCFKDVLYERHIGEILGHLQATPIPSGSVIWLG